ncbi:unnamed protein product [Sphenostylis stenocarpa]|uniref:Uncharacterized protein n=1 Tax=Sphenostylis stenocarpa TaxID=92480 RepID=A0AA86VAB3_9FABA|nr:unnamed protein product [Sphenostylis stenocarpa]
MAEAEQPDAAEKFLLAELGNVSLSPKLGHWVMEQRLNSAKLAWLLHHAGLPTPSWELNHGNFAKALVSWFLNKRALREAGFTEQRKPLALHSGGITGCCTSKPMGLVSLGT